jgi:uncharacterized protein YcbX
MAQRHIGSVGALWRYPVKSFRGESLSEAVMSENGAVGDSSWALRELARGGIMSARTWPAMLEFRASYDNDPALDSNARVRIELPDGKSIYADHPEASARLSDLLRRAVRLERVRTERLTPAELDTIMRGEAYPPRRDFFDEDVVHLVASGTLQHLRSLEARSDFDPRRFRANIYVDTGDETDGFVEDRWLGGVLKIGGEVSIAGMRPAIRCAITTHPQPDLPHDVAILRTAWQYHQAYVGVFASVREPGKIRLGDPVILNT